MSTNARDVALSAAAQAREAALAERRRKEAEEAELRRRKQERLEATFQAALPKLNEWFPGVEWTWNEMGNYGGDVIVWDASEPYPPSFKLLVSRYLLVMEEPKGRYRVEIKVGDYVSDTSMPGHSYFAGSIVKSAADIGRYLEQKEGASK